MSLIYHFYPATPNIGNDLGVVAIHRLIRREAADQPQDIVTIPAKGVSSVIKTGGISRQTVNDINQFGAKALIGPGNLFENNGLDVDPIALGALQAAPLILGVSWGRIYDDRGELQPRTDTMGHDHIRALCNKAAAILVRDEPTRDFLQRLGIENARVIGCPVLTLQPDELPLPPADPRATGTAIISIRNPLLMNISPRLQGRIHGDIRRIIDKLKTMGHDRIALLCHDFRDLRFAAAYPDVPALYTENPMQYMGWLRDCALNVTFRLHSFLPCAVLGTPSVHFTYDERALGLVAASSLQSCNVHYVQSPDPIKEALAMCDDPASLAKAASAARTTWPAFHQIIRDELSAWLRKNQH